MKSNKKQIIWSLIFIALIVLTVWVIVKQNESFSIEGFINYVSAAKWQWIALAFLCMVGFIIFEGLAVLQLCKAFGYKEKVKRGIVYSAVDIYFSAITPSATGGQPASAMCMMQDGIPGAVTTIVLLLNLTLYTIAIIVIGAVCFIFNFDMFRHFSIWSKYMILIGCVVQFVLLTVFLLLVYKEKIVTKIANTGMKILHKLHLMKNIEKRQAHLVEVERKYKECAAAIKNNKVAVFKAFIFNLLQRISLICVSVCVYMGVEGNIKRAFDVFSAQGYVVLGSNSVPIPGAVGAADYLFIDGFGGILKDPVSIELLSRGISFYCCIIICGIITLGIYCTKAWKGMKQKKKC